MKILFPTNNHFPIIILAILGSILVTLGGYFYYEYQKQVLKTEKHAELSAISQLKTDQIVKWQEERLSEANFFTKNDPFSTYALGVIEGNYEYEVLLRNSLLYIMTNNRYDNIYLLSSSGKLLFSVNPDTMPTNPLTLSKVHSVIKTGKVESTDFYYCNIHKSIHLDYLAPVFGDSKVAAILVFSVNPDKYIFPVIENWPTPSKTAETLIISKDGDSVTFLNQLRHVSNKNLSLKLPLTQTDVSAVSAVHGHIGIFEGYDYRGEKVLSDVSKIPDSNWYMISEVDQAEVYHDLYIRTALILIISIISFILLGFIIAWAYSRRQSDIYKELYSKKVELHESQELYKATLYSIGDGVITTDKKGVVKQLNPVAENLTGWKENDARGKALEEVFNIINEETRLKVESPVSRVLKSGLIVGLANHTLLISKDGREIPIADSGAPINDSGGGVVGVVMVFRDQTDEREQQKELARREERFHSTLDNMLEGCQIISSNWEYLYINSVAETHNKRPKEELLGKRYMDMWPGVESTEVFQRIKMCLEEKAAFEMENKFDFPDGRVGWFELRISPIPEGVFILSIDITDRKKESEELINKKRFLFDLIENSGSLVYVKDVEGKYELINKKWEEVTGLKRENVIGKTDELLFTNDIGKKFREMDINVMKSKKVIDSEETLKDEHGVRYFISTKFPLIDQHGNVTGICGMSTNITQRKKDEIELKKSKELIFTIIENLPIGLAVNTVGSNVNFEFMNDNFAKLYGVSRDRLQGPESFWEAVYEDEVFREKIKNKMLSDIASGDLYKLKWFDIPIKKDGKLIRYVNARNIPLEEKGLMISTVWDVTEQKLMEEGLRESEEKFRQLVDSAPQGIFVQTNRKFAYLNPVAVNLFGAKSQDELIGEPVSERFHPDYRELVKQRIEQLNNEQKEVPSIEEVCLKMDETPFDVEVSAVPINYQGENGALVFFQDITQRKNADKELIELKNELEQKVIEKTKELSERVAELERFHEATIERELRIKELRDEIKRLKG